MELQSAHNLFELASFTYHHVLSQSSYMVVAYVGCFLPSRQNNILLISRPHFTHLLITDGHVSYFYTWVPLSSLSPRPKEVFWAFSL